MRAFGRGKANVEKLCASARERGLDAGAAATPREAIEDADIVVSSITLDYTIEPFLDAHWLKGGAFAAVTDLNIPWRDETMDAYSSIFIDDREQERPVPSR